MTYPTISVILPRREHDTAEAAIQAIQNADYPQERIEILEVIGESPSKQRNTGAAAAQGDILYFLDNDSIVPPALFSRIADYYVHSPLPDDDQPAPSLAGIGGPNVTPASDRFLQRLAGYALASPFAHFKMCARYKPTGEIRYAGEKELILCNLSIRKNVFLREQGFNESMYPNEENEFMNRVMAKGCRFLYDPGAVIYRSRRSRFLDFIKQLSSYGRGRAEQTMIEGFSWNTLLFFAPFAFLVYLLLLPLVNGLGTFRGWTLIPLGFYGILAALSAIPSALQEKNPLLIGILPLWYLSMHLSYGVGMISGFWRPNRAAPPSLSRSVDVRVRQRLQSDGIGGRRFLRKNLAKTRRSMLFSFL